MIALTEDERLTLSLYEYRDCFSGYYVRQLYEKVYSIQDSDIDLIFNYFKNFLDYLDSGLPTKEQLQQIQNIVKLGEVSSSKLLSPICKQAHEIKPIEIEIFSSYGCFYNPKQRKVYLGLNPDIFNKIIEVWINSYNKSSNLYFSFLLDYIIKNISYIKSKLYIKKCFTEEHLRTVIYHELSHWISDAINNSHIEKAGDIIAKKNFNPWQHYKVSDMIFSAVEMDAYVNSLYHYKSLIGEDKWNTMTIDDLFSEIPSLSIFTDPQYSSGIKRFKRDLISRLNREGLLGLNMIQSKK